MQSKATTVRLKKKSWLAYWLLPVEPKNKPVLKLWAKHIWLKNWDMFMGHNLAVSRSRARLQVCSHVSLFRISFCIESTDDVCSPRGFYSYDLALIVQLHFNAMCRPLPITPSPPTNYAPGAAHAALSLATHVRDNKFPPPLILVALIADFYCRTSRLLHIVYPGFSHSPIVKFCMEP
jgi:hypothetical protein